ncbi:hard surface induced 3 [Fusarium subglutinans]|uniref:Hard surface induced 3 n=1 Tax=Gibberella subglutinans TaxID=42677 RepID=A0A8H5L7X3_GIBSU|nr:hard surface induced 3 [Fusarium subglutinans]KAF5585806.1 hard surface induced 3 [Fusarium subglutinans]
MTSRKEGHVQWIEGLRGIASTLVWIAHVTRAFDYDLYSPVSGEGLRPRLLQLPFIRIMIQGRLGVIIFVYVTGYVCALKPLSLFRRGNYEAGWSCVSKSALRRLPRLLYPSAIATTLAWSATQLGLFEAAKTTESYYLTQTVEDKLPLYSAIRELFFAIFKTWTGGGNKYDRHQGTLFELFKGGMYVLLFVSATAKVQAKFRMGASLVLWAYLWACGRPYFMQFWWGVFMNDLHNSRLSQRISWSKSRYIPFFGFLSIAVGLFMASFPESRIELAPWSRWQNQILSAIVPKDSEFPKFASSFGFCLLTIGGALLPGYTDILSHRVLVWLGKRSFSVYLLHGTLLRWLLTWMVYGNALSPNLQVQQPGSASSKLEYAGNTWLLFCLPAWLGLLYGFAEIWTRYVDTAAERFTSQLVAYTRQEESKELSLV